MPKHALESLIGTLSSLTTTAKTNIVAAVNELKTSVDLKAPLADPTFTGTVSGVTKTHVGLANVDNTADTAKPVSTAQQTALDLKAPLASPAFTGSPTGITKTHVGLGNVDNTADTSKPISTAVQNALGVLTSLTTTAQSSLVAAINEVDADLAVLSTANDANDQKIIRWNSGTSSWPARPAGWLFGVIFLSTNDDTATAPTDINKLYGDIWRAHPDQTPP